MGVNGKTAVKKFSAIVDSGTSLILGNSSQVKQLYAATNATEVDKGVYARKQFNNLHCYVCLNVVSSTV